MYGALVCVQKGESIMLVGCLWGVCLEGVEDGNLSMC